MIKGWQRPQLNIERARWGNLKIVQKLYASYALLFVLLAATGLISLDMIKRMESSADRDAGHAAEAGALEGGGDRG